MRSLLSKFSICIALLFASIISVDGQSTVFHKIAQDPDLQEFEDALRESGLDQVFRQNGVFTIFAPTNDVWPNLPATISKEALIDVILTHCVAGHYRSDDFANGFAVSTMNQRNLTVAKNSNGIFINGNKLDKLDIQGSNGLVHVISNWIPKNTTTETTVMSIIENSTKHVVLETIIKNANLESRFEDRDKQLTVFAPSDEAFFNLTSAKLDKFLGTNINYIENHIFYHVVEQLIEEGDFMNGQKLTAANNQELSITINFNGTYVNNVKIGFAGIEAVNGIVYTIHKVLIPEELPDFSIADFIDQSDDHSLLSKYIEDTGFRPLLAAPGALTYFAPTDLAWNSLDPDVLEMLVNDIDAMHNVLQNHLLVDKHYIVDLLDEEDPVFTVNGFELVFDDDNLFVYVNDAKFQITDIEADNGLVHVIDKVLIEEVVDRFTVRDILMINEDLSSFSAYVESSGFGEELDMDGPFTVFAPSNSAMANLPLDIKDNIDNGTMEDLIAFIENHIITDLYETPLLTHELNLTAKNGFIIKVTIDADDDIFINDSKIVVRNLQADNGVVHVIDTALFTGNEAITIYDYVTQNENHSVLSTSIQKASLEFLYEGSGPLTLFAPTNRAFNNLPGGFLDSLFTGPTANLVDLLLGHTLNGAYTIDSLLNIHEIDNANAELIRVIRNNGEIYVNNAKVEVSDVVLENGIIHVIDAVLSDALANNSILNIIQDSDEHNLLLDAIELSDSGDKYNLDSPLTLFAPTDDAINALGANVWFGLINDPNGSLIDFLNMHTYNGELRTSDMVDGMTLTMSNGELIRINIDNDRIFANDAELIIKDITADNGVVHVIDAVLEPYVPRNTVYDIIADNSEYSMLEEAIIAAGMDQLLIDESSITFFAPDNNAFNNMDPVLYDQLMSDPSGSLKDFLEYHLFNHNITTNSMFDGLTLVMANSGLTSFTDIMGELFINDSRIVNGDLTADNGYVHGIDIVLIPVEEIVTVYDVVSGEEDLSTYHSMVNASGLDTELKESDLISVFAPSNEAFDALPPSVLSSLNSDPNGLLRDVLLAHHTKSLLLSSFLTDGLNISMEDGSIAVVSLDQNDIYINDARIEVRDLEADNGVVHVIDAFLVELTEPYTIYDLISDRPDNSFLVSAIDAASYDVDLDNANGITFFAPTNSAIGMQSQNEWNELLADPDGLLRDFMLNHSFDGEIRFADLYDGLELDMLAGLKATISIGSDGFYINDAKISVFELKADNGIVYIIDAVIKEPSVSKTIYDYVSASTDHVLLKQLLDESGLNDMLSNDPDLTLFAPTDEAFNALPAGQLIAYLDDPEGSLKDLLIDHVYNGLISSSDMTDGYEFQLSGGLEALIRIDSEGKFINESKILEEDVSADNGLIHIVESVIMPRPSYVSEEELDNIRIYPNPTNSQLFIELSNTGTEKIENITIMNQLGQTVWTQNVNTRSYDINIDHLESGMYFLILDKHWNNSFKIIKK